jgi:hypothetical protein
MSDFDRRRFLKGILGALAQAAGTVVVASTAATATAQGQPPEGSETPPGDVQDRADRLATDGAFSGEFVAANEFRNGGFRDTPLGSFRNTPVGSFRNTPVGNFRNGPLGGFRNTPLGHFTNGGWPNGPWGGGWHNGGWPNWGWKNWW